MSFVSFEYAAKAGAPAFLIFSRNQSIIATLISRKPFPYERHQKPLMERIQNIVTLLVLLFGATTLASAQDAPSHKQNVRPGTTTAKTSSETPPRNSPTFSYEFTQPQFYLRHIVIEHDSSGQGKITFERLNEEIPIVENLQISPEALKRIISLWEALRFLDSETNYQSDRQYAHMGTVKLSMVGGERKRTAEFNWSDVKEAADLAAEYRRVADQASFVFDVSVARENQPLNMPKLMESFESLLKRNALSDPKQVIPLLKDISSDERLPLIARNHAIRLITKIDK